MARKSHKRGSKRKIPLKVLERRAAHLNAVVRSRGGHVPGLGKRRTKHRRSR